MSGEAANTPWRDADGETIGPDISDLVTEDGAAVDNVYSERQMRLLVEPLYAGWPGPPADEDGNPRSFFAAANVGVFAVAKNNPLVPDVLVSVDVEPPSDVHDKERRSYFVWEYGKVPDVVIEVVSNNVGGELTDRKRGYAKMRVPVYVVWDPEKHVSDEELTVFWLAGNVYRRAENSVIESLGLELQPWVGAFEGIEARWLRWRDLRAAWLPTGAERASYERARAESERARAETERARAEALADKLRALGIDPESV